MKKLMLCLMMALSTNVFCALSQKDTALFQAINSNNLEAVEKALANGADANVINDCGYDSPLETAEREGYTEIVKLLIDNGARMDALGHCSNHTILHSAVTNNHIEIIKLLLSKNANVNARDKYLNTPLHTAADFEHIAVAQFLIEKGADVNAMNQYGETPLYMAIKYDYFRPIRSIKLVELFLDHGVDINSIVSSEKKLTPLLWAKLAGQKEIVKLLLSRGADWNL